jgi:hypothetical protein
MARSIPAPVAGKSRVSIRSPLGAARMEYTCFLAWVSTPTTNGWEYATIVIAVLALSSFRGHGQGRYGPVPVRVEVTSEQHCDESRPRAGGGQSSDQVTEVGRAGTGRPPRRRTSRTKGTPKTVGQAFCESRPRGGTTCTYSASQSQTSHPNPHSVLTALNAHKCDLAVPRRRRPMEWGKCASCSPWALATQW